MSNLSNENKEIDKSKVTDEYFLNKLTEELEKEYYSFGAYYDYNGLDVQHLKNPIFGKETNK